MTRSPLSGVVFKSMRRIYFALITAALGIAFGAGYASLYLFEVPIPTPGTANEVTKLKSQFVNSTKHHSKIELNRLFVEGASSELTDVKKALPHSNDYPSNEIQAVYQYSETCKDLEKLAPQVRVRALRKALIWHRFECGQIKKLHPWFFLSRPYVHPSGHSYAYLALWKGQRLVGNPASWVQKHIRLFHVMELKELIKMGFQLEPERAALSDLNLDQAEDLHNGSVLVLSDRFALLKVTDLNDEFSKTVYLSFPRRIWDSFISI